MNYIGSKQSLLEFLEDSIGKVTRNKGNVFLDLFAGTGAVGKRFKMKGLKVIANDIQFYSYVLNKHYIENHTPLKFEKLLAVVPNLGKSKIQDRLNVVCKYLNELKGAKGLIYNNYCLGGTKYKSAVRQYFSDENGMKCDAIRQKIGEWQEKDLINNNEYYFLLASLLESIDKHANTASVYGAFLKHLKKSAQKTLTLSPAPLYINSQEHKVYNEDVNKLIKNVRGDILYLDPPYNHRQYATNYHLLETIAKYDNPKVHGKTGLRDYKSQKSLYCSRVEVKKAFADLVANATARYIFLSYNDEGLMSPEEIKKIMSTRGKYGVFTKEHNRFKADKDKNRKHKANKTVEYLHYVVCK